MQRLLPDETERSGIPERGGTTVAEDDLVALGEREQVFQTTAHASDDVLDGLLPVAGAEHGRTDVDQGLQLLGANLGRAATEASVGGKKIGGNDRQIGHGVARPCVDGIWPPQASRVS